MTSLDNALEDTAEANDTLIVHDLKNFGSKVVTATSNDDKLPFKANLKGHLNIQSRLWFTSGQRVTASK